jgi:hypothetical protein
MKFKEYITEQDQQQSIDFKTPEVQGPKKVNVAFVCFEDQTMNGSSDLLFSMPSQNWRNIQTHLKMGFLGSFDPDVILQSLQTIQDAISGKALSSTEETDKVIKQHLGIENGTAVLGKLNAISVAAQSGNTKVRVMLGNFIG